MKRNLSLSALGVAAAVALAGCGSSTESITPADEPSISTQETTTSTDAGTEVSAEHNDADVLFAQMMIPHHQQAVEMSDMMLAKDNISPEITELATQIKDAQGPEINTMTSWLEEWDAPAMPEGGMEGYDMGSMDGADGMGSMNGMMDDDQMAELDAAEGDDATRIFLESMIEHHNGAVDMAEEEIDNGENPEAIALAETIVETQQAEIQEMEALLAEL